MIRLAVMPLTTPNGSERMDATNGDVTEQLVAQLTGTDAGRVGANAPCVVHQRAWIQPFRRASIRDTASAASVRSVSMSCSENLRGSTPTTHRLPSTNPRDEIMGTPA